MFMLALGVKAQTTDNIEFFQMTIQESIPFVDEFE